MNSFARARRSPGWSSMLILSAFAAFVPQQASADPISYTINFTLINGTPAPTSGSFLYDPNQPLGQRFSSFFVTWNTIPFDLTSSANAPSGNPGCALDGFAIVVTQSACSPHGSGYPSWTGSGFEGSGGFFFQDSTPGLANASVYAEGYLSDAVAYGTWTASPQLVPEPSALTLALTGAGLLLGLRRLRLSRATT
jgi:hypothetical protein